MDRCYSVLKSIMFFFNALFWLLGVTIFSVGVAIHLDPEFRVAVSGHIPGANAGANLFIVVGVAMVTTGFLGCCGAVRESQCMLLSFFVILAIVFASLIGSGVWAAASKDRMSGLLESELRKHVAAYYKDPARKDVMDGVQNLFECCGIKDGGADYKRLRLEVPNTCGSRVSNADGCYFKIANTLVTNLAKITGVGVSIAFMVLLGMVLSMMMFCNLRDAALARNGGNYEY